MPQHQLIQEVLYEASTLNNFLKLFFFTKDILVFRGNLIHTSQYSTLGNKNFSVLHCIFLELKINAHEWILHSDLRSAGDANIQIRKKFEH